MLCDRSSTPARYRAAVPAERVSQIERLRRQRLSGPQIACRLAMPRSTVGTVVRRLGLGRLSRLDPKPPAHRYQRQRPGELIHIDTKKLGRIDGIGHRITGHHTGMIRNRGIGWEMLHLCIDDASRLAYTEIQPDEKKHSAIAFLRRAVGWFVRHGVDAEAAEHEAPRQPKHQIGPITPIDGLSRPADGPSNSPPSGARTVIG
jgi:hypothetical protein